MKTIDLDALTQQGWSKFWSVNADNTKWDAVPLHLQKPAYGQAEQTSSTPPETEDPRALSQRCEPLTYWLKDKMLRNNFHAWLRPRRLPSTDSMRSAWFNLFSLQLVHRRLTIRNQSFARVMLRLAYSTIDRCWSRPSTRKTHYPNHHNLSYITNELVIHRNNDFYSFP